MISENLEIIRKTKKLSIYDLEKLSGVSCSVLQAIEKYGHEPRLSILIRIAQALDVRLDELTA